MERDLRLVRFRLYNLDISTHTLTWSVTRRIKSIIKLIYISTHTLTWSVTTSAVMSLICLSFQLTRSRGAWRWFNGSIRSTKKFQLTRSRGAWLCRITFTWKIYLNFNSHAHVERDEIRAIIPLALSISTHTLTWSVTVYISHWADRGHISTHTLTWSVTITLTLIFTIASISTHTLTWSVT